MFTHHATDGAAFILRLKNAVKFSKGLPSMLILLGQLLGRESKINYNIENAFNYG